MLNTSRHPRPLHRLLLPLVLPSLLALAGCGDSNVSSKDEARRAYLGLDASIDKAIDLGFKGFNEAQSANIPTEMTTGALGGTLTVTGQVDQGASANKQMRLNVAMAMYSDVKDYGYDTSANADGGTSLPALGMSLQGIPSGTLSGTLAGTFQMNGELSGSVTLNLTFTGDLQSEADGGASRVIRKPGTTHVTGTATSPAGTFAVDVTK